MATEKPLVTNNFYLNLLKSIKKEIREVQGSEDREIRNYYRKYAEFLEKTGFKESNLLEIKKSSSKNGILLIGDFHSLNESQKQFMKIVDFLISEKVNLVIVLEMVYKIHQKHLEDFLNDEINLKDFFKSINYFSNWGFDTLSYSSLLLFLKSYKLKSYGINFKGSLHQRDELMANEIARIKEENKGSLVVGLVGDLHLALNHMPKEIEKKGYKSTIVYQNSETIIKKLMRAKRDPYKVFELKEDVFLINNTPPWIKMQSYLTFLEHGSEGYSLKYGFSSGEEEYDFATTVHNYIKALKDIFTLHNKRDDDFVVYTLDDISFLNSSYFRKEPGKTYAKLIRNGKSLYINKDKTIYTPFQDVNHTVEEAMHYLMEKDLPICPSEDCFFERIHYFFAGFLASKVINPMRQALSTTSLQKFIKEWEKMVDEKEKNYLSERVLVCMLISDFFEHLSKENVSSLSFSGYSISDHALSFELSRQIGYYLGKIIFDDYIKGSISGSEIKDLIFTNTDYKGFSIQNLKRVEILP